MMSMSQEYERWKAMGADIKDVRDALDSVIHNRRHVQLWTAGMLDRLLKAMRLIHSFMVNASDRMYDRMYLEFSPEQREDGFDWAHVFSQRGELYPDPETPAFGGAKDRRRWKVLGDGVNEARDKLLRFLYNRDHAELLTATLIDKLLKAENQILRFMFEADRRMYDKVNPKDPEWACIFFRDRRQPEPSTKEVGTPSNPLPRE